LHPRSFQLKQRIFPMNSPIKIADAGSVAPPDYKYSYLHAKLAEQLISIFRTTFPHDALPDEFYQHVIRKLDEKVAQNADLMRLVGEGVDALNDETGLASNGDVIEPERLCSRAATDYGGHATPRVSIMDLQPNTGASLDHFYPERIFAAT
jgi:hypothetical protein